MDWINMSPLEPRVALGRANHLGGQGREGGGPRAAQFGIERRAEGVPEGPQQCFARGLVVLWGNSIIPPAACPSKPLLRVSNSPPQAVWCRQEMCGPQRSS